MIATGAETMVSPSGRPVENWIFKDRESIEKRFGMEMEKILERQRTEEGKRELLERMKSVDPALNGNVEHALQHVNRNIEVLQKKEGFLTKMVKLPGRAVSAVGRGIKKHPILSASVGIAALLALLYFTGPLATTSGEYGQQLVDAFKKTMGKLHVATPEVAVDQVAKVPVTGEVVGQEAADLATRAFQSPGEAIGQTYQAAEAVKAATGVEPGAALPNLSQGAAEVMQSPEAAEALKQATEKGVDVVDPLQRMLRDLPPQ